MKTIKITSKQDLEEAITYIMENGRGGKEIETDILNCHVSLEKGIEFEFTSVR